MTSDWLFLRGGEHDCCLGLPLEPASLEDDRALGPPGLPLEAETGRALGPPGLSLEAEAGRAPGPPGLSLEAEAGRAPGPPGLSLEAEAGRAPGAPGLSLDAEAGRALGAPGLSLEAEAGLSGNDVLKFGGASREKPGTSSGFQGLDFTAGEMPRDGTGFFRVAGIDLVNEVWPGAAAHTGGLEGVDDWRIGVADLEAGEVRIGVDERAAVLVGVDDLAAGATDLAEDNVGRDVGVDGLECLAVADREGRPVGVAGLDTDLCPPADADLLLPALVEFSPESKVVPLDPPLVLEAGSSWIFISCNRRQQEFQTIA
uniref:Uncharacterized protein n=1 Tax=Salix viminalis TaxID=40686 RepID=A0A6N2MN89_SALVM